jgi:hypothetical protein
VCAEIKSGNLRTSASVQFSTANGVATGMSNFSDTIFFNPQIPVIL